MERRWSVIVGQDDVVLYLGDLTAGLRGRVNELKELIGRLPGRKVLVRGNHDHQKEEFYKEAGFERVVDYITIPNILFVHVQDSVDQVKPHPWADITRMLREEHKPLLTFHGHDHRKAIPEYEGHFNCAADRHAFIPFTLRSALDRCGLGAYTEKAYEDIYLWLNEKNDASTKDAPAL